MRIIDSSYDIYYNPVETNRARMVHAARICYQSESSGRAGDSRLIQHCVRERNNTPIEKSEVEVTFLCDRGISHELVRYRHTTVNQESTRYCNYANGRFGNEIVVVRPVMIIPGTVEYVIWKKSCERAEKSYFTLIEGGATPEIARSVLPTCLKTELTMAANLWEWYHILDQRTARGAHPDVRYLMHGLLIDLAMDYPEIFADLRNERNPEILQDFAVLRNRKKGVEND